MLIRIGQLLGLDRAGVAHALRLAFAAWLAFAIASLSHVENAYWAAMPIWVVAQSSRGLLIERGFFRILGTLLGAAAGFGILHLIPNPYLALTLVSIWVAINAGVTKMLRGVHGYGAMMAGMTAAVVVIPSVLHPAHAAAIAIARVDCTLIGVVVVTLVTGLWTPASRRQDFYRQVRGLSGDAVAFVAALLKGLPPQEVIEREQRLVREMSEVQVAASLVTAGSIEGYRRLHHVDVLIIASLGVMATARVCNHHLRRDGNLLGVEPDDIAAIADTLTAGFPWPADRHQDLRAGIARLEARLADKFDRLIAAAAVFDEEPKRADATSFGRKATYLAPNRDERMAIETGLMIGCATLIASLVGHLSGWQTGDLAALGVCIFSMVLSSLPTPRAIVPYMWQGCFAGVAIAVLYRFLIQPHVTTVPQLLVSIAPFLLIGGFARTSPKIGPYALDAVMAFLLASQAVLPSVTDRTAILNGTAAILLAVSLVCSGFMLLPQTLSRRTRSAMAAIQNDLLRLVTRRGTIDPDVRVEATSRQILRLGLHLTKATDLAGKPGFSLLAALNLGEAIVWLRALAARANGAPHDQTQVSDALSRLRRMREDPTGVADDIERRARGTVSIPIAQAMQDVADGLRASRALLG